MSILDAYPTPRPGAYWPPGFRQRAVEQARRIAEANHTTRSERMSDAEIRERIRTLDAERANLTTQLEENRKTRLAASSASGFRTQDLVLAATSRCSCGALLAYPRDIGIDGAWSCARTLVSPAAEQDGVTHQAPLPFRFWDVKARHASEPGPTDDHIFGAPSCP